MRHGNLADGVLGLWSIDDQFCAPFFIIGQVNPLDGFVYADDAGGHIHIIPLQGADFADTEAGIEADENAQVLEREMLFHISHQLPLFGDRKDIDFVPLPLGRIDNVHPVALHQAMFRAIPKNHSQDHHYIADCFPA